MLKNVVNSVIRIFIIIVFLVLTGITPALAEQNSKLNKIEEKFERRSIEWEVQTTYSLKQIKGGFKFEYVLEKLRPKYPSTQREEGLRLGRFKVYRDGIQIYEVWGFDPPEVEGWPFQIPIAEVYGNILFSLHSGGTSCCTTIGIWLGYPNEGGVLFLPIGMNKASFHDFNKNNLFEIILYDWENTHGLIPESDSIDVKFMHIFEYSGLHSQWFKRVKGGEFKAPLMKHASKMYNRMEKYLKIGNLKNAQAAAAVWLAAVESTEIKEEIRQAVQAFKNDKRFSEEVKENILKALLLNDYFLLGIYK